MRDDITTWAKELGFDAVAFAPARLPEKAAFDLDDFLGRKLHGDMGWMEEHAARRRDPQALWPEARTAIILAQNYGPDYDPLEKLAEKSSGLVSCYALGKDYHDVIKKKLKRLATRIATETGAGVKVFVDTAPLMEKPLAAQSALGWQGKHTCVVSREFGSWLFLGEILTTLELPADEPEAEFCGSCRKCLDICPTQAFIGPHRLDATRCISYLTIEHKGHIPAEFRAAIGNRIYGCDDCLSVCPWNKFAKASQEAAYAAREQMPLLPLSEILLLDDSAFRARFAGSPVKRIGRNRFIRNALVAAGNSGDATLLPAVEALLGDESPLVRASAVWALGQLGAPELILDFQHRLLPNEADPDVQNEWRNHGKS